MKRILLSALAVTLSAGSYCGTVPKTASDEPTSNTFSTEGWWKPAPPPYSPVVNPDKTITFRIKAARASVVELLFDEWDVVPRPMCADNEGNWEITIGPVEPRVYQYNFMVDGLRVIDPVNPVVKAGTEVYGSVVEVYGDPPRYDEAVAPGGEVHIISYVSTPLHRLRQAYIYLPEGYDPCQPEKYPVLYLRHGGGDNETSWTRDGRAAVIMDNLIRDGRAAKMLVVMTNGLTDGSWAGGSTPEGMELLERELLEDIIPMVERRYNVASDKWSRAIAGLSMGGGQAYVMGLRNPSVFGYIGQFSAGILSDPFFDPEQYIPGRMRDAQQINEDYRLLWISCGTKDPRYRGHLDFVRTLRDDGTECEFHELEYGHEWEFWRRQLHDFAQRIFR